MHCGRESFRCCGVYFRFALGKYANPEGLPCFPLIGPEGVGTLADSVEWDIPDGVSRMSISFDNAKNRIRLLGGKVNKPKGSSHYEVEFKGGRTWPLDVNYPEVPERYLKELIPITGQELDVIKYVLLYGKWPKQKKRFERIAAG